MILRRLSAILIVMASLFAVGTRTEFGDSFAGHDFPLISPTEKEDGQTRIMSFNILAGGLNGEGASQRAPAIAAAINAIAPDCFGLQESNGEWITKMRLLLPQYACVGVDRETGRKLTGGEHTSIFYLRSKYKLLDSGSFWLSETPDVPSYGPGAAYPRVCTWVRLRNRITRETFVHINTHFDHVSEEARLFAANCVNEFIEEHFPGMNVVFTADMNTTPEGEAYAIMTERLKDARLNADDCVPYGTFHNTKPEEAADYYIDCILCSPGVHVCEYRTVTEGANGRFISDHFPIYADLDFSDNHAGEPAADRYLPWVC